MIYVCKRCNFTFERAGDVEQCPSCGKLPIRLAGDQETLGYLMRKEALHKEPNLVEHSFGEINK